MENDRRRLQRNGKEHNSKKTEIKNLLIIIAVA